MNLYLVQHAEAKPESEDPERRLSERGWAEIRKMARFAAERLGIRVPPASSMGLPSLLWPPLCICWAVIYRGGP